MSEQITYLKDTSRYPKVTRNEVKQPKMQITSEEYNKVVEALEAVESGKQPTLVSGVNIATVNGQSLLNGGNITIQGGGGGGSITVDDQLDVTSENAIQNKAVAAALNGKQATLVSGTNIATINGQSLLGGGNIEISAASVMPPVFEVDMSNGCVMMDDGDGECTNFGISDTDGNLYFELVAGGSCL